MSAPEVHSTQRLATVVRPELELCLLGCWCVRQLPGLVSKVDVQRSVYTLVWLCHSLLPTLYGEEFILEPLTAAKLPGVEHLHGAVPSVSESACRVLWLSHRSNLS